MKWIFHLLLGILLLMASTVYSIESLRTFTNTEGKVLKDKIIKYDPVGKTVVLKRNGPLQLNMFSNADQHYILQWNQVNGFKSVLRFKAHIQRKNWARIKHEQSITPFRMDALQIPGKTNPVHHVTTYGGCSEQTTIYLEAQGYEIVLQNLNLFPLGNIVIESKLFYEQEYYIIPDDVFNSANTDYNNTYTSNKVCTLSETVPILIPREEVVLHTECALIIDHQLERKALSDIPDGSSGTVTDEQIDAMTGGADRWEDHERRRRGKVIGAWVRIGIKSPEGGMVWRDITDPPYLADKIDWESDKKTEPEE